MKGGGAMLAQLLRELTAMVRPGVTTNSLEQYAREWIKTHNVHPSFLGFKGYPAVLCVSLNEQVVHTVPSERIIMEGDLVKIDVGIMHKGLHTDIAATVLATASKNPGQVYPEKMRLISTTEQALEAGIAAARAGNTVGDISEAIQKVIEENRFKVLKELGGHGIGAELHEDPFIPNFRDRQYDQELFPGVTLALEPIPSNGSMRISDGADGFSFVTSDGSLAAHFEHTIAVTENEPIILTK